MNYRVGLAWILAIIGIASITRLYHGETSSFLGVAEASETSISVESGTEIVKIPVLTGQAVKIGDTLVQLRRPELSLRISELVRELEGHQGKSGLTEADIERRLSEVRTTADAKRHQLNFEIERLREEYTRNRDLALRLQSLPAGAVPPADTNDAMWRRIRSMERELQMVKNSERDQVSLLQGSRGLQRTSGEAEREAMRRELDMLRQEEARLVILSREDAVVATVFFRDGEKVSPFAPILTLSPHSPSLVRGYIHERVYNRVGIGDSVDVYSTGERTRRVRGKVVGMGSRIIEFPIRLRKMPEMLVWGREVTVRISPKNSFLLGELVTISPRGEWGVPALIDVHTPVVEATNP